MADQGWDDAADVTMQVVVKVAVQYSFSAAITTDQCKTAVAKANNLLLSSGDPDVDKVTCVGGAASNDTATTAAPTAITTATTTAAAARRLQAAVMDVEISFEDADAAVTAVESDGDAQMAALNEALSATIGTEITSTGAIPGAVTVELEVTVTADEAITAPPATSLETAVTETATAPISSVTATVSVVEVTFTRMPCDEGVGVCGSGYQLLANAATIGCAAELCTTSDRDTCCTRMVVSDARGMCVLNSFLLLLLRNIL